MSAKPLPSERSMHEVDEKTQKSERVTLALAFQKALKEAAPPRRAEPGTETEDLQRPVTQEPVNYTHGTNKPVVRERAPVPMRPRKPLTTRPSIFKRLLSMKLMRTPKSHSLMLIVGICVGIGFDQAISRSMRPTPKYHIQAIVPLSTQMQVQAPIVEKEMEPVLITKKQSVPPVKFNVAKRAPHTLAPTKKVDGRRKTASKSKNRSSFKRVQRVSFLGKRVPQ
jgi:hypothetical protein